MGKRLQRKHGSSAAFDKGLRRVLSAVWMVALPFGGPSVRAQETEGFDTGVVLGEEDLAERAEIARNTFRRITPGNEPLVQDVGTWPALWEAFGANWATAAVGREYGAWVVPIQVAQENGATVIRDADGRELWRGATDFAKEESASVTLTGGLVAEADWDGYEGVRNFANVWQNGGIFAEHWQNGGVGRAVPASRTNGLRFTSIEAGTNGTVALSLAWEEDGDADIFVYAVPHDPGERVFTWTNDENQVVTVTNAVWTMAGPNFSGFDNDWEWRGTATVTNGEGLFIDTGIPDYLGVMRFYAAAEANDTDGDGWNDGWERFVFHTDPTVPNNGNPNSSGTNETTNVFWFVTTTNEYAQRYGRPDCSLNAPAQRVVTIPVSSAAPTTNSIVHDVTVTGFVDDNIKVDGTGVDWRRNVHEFDHRSITNEIADLQSGQFSLELWDWPRADYEGPNEARFGDTNGVPFRVEWTWKVPVEVVLEAVYSGQIPGRTCNEAGADGPMCMGTRSNDLGYLSIVASVHPAELPVAGLIEVRHENDVLASSAIQNPVTTIEFAPAGGRELYDVAAGADMNGDGVLQATETTIVLKNAVRLLKHSDYVYSCTVLRGMAGLSTGIGSHLLEAFLDDEVPPDAIDLPVSLTAAELTHAMGAFWSFDCDAMTRMYIYGPETDVAVAVGKDSALVETVAEALGRHSAEVASWFAANTGDVHVFGPWNWGTNGVELDGLGLSLAFGHVNPEGTVSVTVRRSDFKVVRAVYDGQFTDVYDFSYTGAYPSIHGATAQSGFSTWGQSGRVFKVRVGFSCDTEEFDYCFGGAGGVSP